MSAPRLLENSLDFNSNDNIISREVQHIFFMSGYTATLSDDLKVRPQVLFKYAEEVRLATGYAKLLLPKMYGGSTL